MSIFTSTFSFFFFNDTATTEIYTLSLHDALPISPQTPRCSEKGLPVNRHTSSARTTRRGLLRSMCSNVAGSSPADRKSTRLNSSHSQISYAVFCLKKKTNKKNTIVKVKEYARLKL